MTAIWEAILFGMLMLSVTTNGYLILQEREQAYVCEQARG
jgi:hypothetical protein